MWPREVPLDGSPPDVAARMAAYSHWLQQSTVPKLFLNAEPGVFITGKVREMCRTFANQKEVTVSGLHFVQEDDPQAVGQAIAMWLTDLA
jgi:haloalkane dehalogenase